MNPTSDDPTCLLSDQGQWTEPWGSSENGESCEKCGGSGRSRHECWSCLLTGARPECPVCSGAVRWEDECPVCRGTGQVDGERRHGVSVFPTIEGLYRYMLASDADVDDCLILEIDADPAGDVDFDADQGPMLVIPQKILGCAAVDHELARRMQERIGSERT